MDQNKIKNVVHNFQQIGDEFYKKKLHRIYLVIDYVIINSSVEKTLQRRLSRRDTVV